MGAAVKAEVEAAEETVVEASPRAAKENPARNGLAPHDYDHAINKIESRE